MNYIVLDLEWNQSADGKAYTNSRIPFEIIQIGAVKLDENFQKSHNLTDISAPQSIQNCMIRFKKYLM